MCCTDFAACRRSFHVWSFLTTEVWYSAASSCFGQSARNHMAFETELDRLMYGIIWHDCLQWETKLKRVLNCCVLLRSLKSLLYYCVWWESCEGEHCSMLRGGAGCASSYNAKQRGSLAARPADMTFTPCSSQFCYPFAVQRHYLPGQEW